jgi:hypothetical protein
MWEEVVTSTDEEAGVSTGITYSLKYEQITTDDYFKFMIPLMRISEMYLIQAECSNNLEEVQNCLHQIRWNRNLTSDEVVTEENKDQLITEEFARSHRRRTAFLLLQASCHGRICIGYRCNEHL